jgi:hypothetical protein
VSDAGNDSVSRINFPPPPLSDYVGAPGNSRTVTAAAFRSIPDSSAVQSRNHRSNGDQVPGRVERAFPAVTAVFTG